MLHDLEQPPEVLRSILISQLRPWVQKPDPNREARSRDYRLDLAHSKALARNPPRQLVAHPTSVPTLFDAGEAAAVLSPTGRVSSRTIAEAMRSGSLRSVRIGRSRFTTEAWLNDWTKQCQDPNWDPASTSTRSGKSGSSVMARRCEAQASAEATAKELIARSRTTSSASGARRTGRKKRVN